jgi:hypothetical protein
VVDTETITDQVHITLPTGALPLAGLNTSFEKTCTSEAPSTIALTMYLGETTQVGQGLVTVYTNGAAPGMEYVGRIVTPVAFRGSSGDPYPDYGSWNWTQLITCHDYRLKNGTWENLFERDPGVQNGPVYALNGHRALDNTYPYAGWYVAWDLAQGNSDTPQEPLEADPAVTAKNLQDDFDNWMMYLPPGGGSQAVPVKKAAWDWEFSAVKNGAGVWSTPMKNQHKSYGASFPEFPIWDLKLINNWLYYQ